MEPFSNGLKMAAYIVTLIFVCFILASIKSEYINSDIAETIVTYLQSVLMLIAGYYWGSSSKKQGVPEFPKMDEVIKSETEKLQAAQVEAVKKEADK